jgi:hypothetical protein
LLLALGQPNLLALGRPLLALERLWMPALGWLLGRGLRRARARSGRWLLLGQGQQRAGGLHLALQLEKALQMLQGWAWQPSAALHP